MHFLSSTSVEAFWDEIEKIAGLRDAVRLALTGKVPLRHGTSKAIAKKIRESGLKPQGSKGISDLMKVPGEAGIAFTTRSPQEAAAYAVQQAGLERGGRLRAAIPESLKKRFRETDYYKRRKQTLGFMGSPMSAGDLVQKETAGLLGKLPGGKEVVEARVPWQELRKIEAPGSELHAPVVSNIRAVLRGVGGPSAEKVMTIPFLKHVPVQGGLPASRIVGSPDYQRTTLQSLREHAAGVRQDPRGFGKELLRTLTDVSHRPSTLLNQVPLFRRLPGPVE
jgi:hypothetical protein